MNIIEEMKNRVSMRELLESYGIYPHRGRNIYRCLSHSPDKNPSAGMTKDEQKFHCFSAETEIITKDGIRRIGDLVEKQVEIINGNGEWETVTIKNYGKQKLYKITLCRGGNKYGKITKDIYTTDKHRWFITRKTKLGFAERTTDELQNGNILLSIETKAKDVKFDIDGITANEEYCKDGVWNSIGIVTALCPYIGYSKSSQIAKEALKENRKVYDVVIEKNIMTQDELDDIFQKVVCDALAEKSDCNIMG